MAFKFFTAFLIIVSSCLFAHLPLILLVCDKVQLSDASSSSPSASSTTHNSRFSTVINTSSSNTANSNENDDKVPAKYISANTNEKPTIKSIPVQEQRIAFVPKNHNAATTTNETEDNKRDNGGKQKQRQRTLMDYESIALALSHTCNINHQLQRRNSSTTNILNRLAHEHQTENKRTSSTKLTTDIFHINSNDDAYQWSEEKLTSNLSQFVKSLSALLGCDQNPYVKAIALIYLDRACSIRESDRYASNDSNNGDSRNIRCPFLTFESVHKLYLTATVLACRIVRNEFPTGMGYHDDYTMKYANLLRTDEKSKETSSSATLDGITVTYDELRSWLEYMISSIRSLQNDLSVTSSELQAFLRRWSNRFPMENVTKSELQNIYDYNNLTHKDGMRSNQIHGSLGSNSLSQQSSSWEKVEGYGDDKDESSVQQDENTNTEGSSSSSSLYSQQGDDRIVEEYTSVEQFSNHGDGYSYHYEREEILYTTQGGNTNMIDGSDTSWW